MSAKFLYVRGVKRNSQGAAVSAGFRGFLSIICQLRPQEQGVLIIWPIKDFNGPLVPRTSRKPADTAALQDWSFDPCALSELCRGGGRVGLRTE